MRKTCGLWSYNLSKVRMPGPRETASQSQTNISTCEGSLTQDFRAGVGAGGSQLGNNIELGVSQSKQDTEMIMHRKWPGMVMYKPESGHCMYNKRSNSGEE